MYNYCFQNTFSSDNMCTIFLKCGRFQESATAVLWLYKLLYRVKYVMKEWILTSQGKTLNIFFFSKRKKTVKAKVMCQTINFQFLPWKVYHIKKFYCLHHTAQKLEKLCNKGLMEFKVGKGTIKMLPLLPMTSLNWKENFGF